MAAARRTSAMGNISTKASIVALITQSASASVFNRAAVSLDGDIDMQGNSSIVSDTPAITLGDAYANGKIYNSKNKYGPSIGGDATATGTIDSKITVGGIRTPAAPPISISSPIDISAYTLEAQTQGQIVASFVKNSGTWNLGSAGNPSYITGDLLLTGSASINVLGTVYVGGKFSMANGCSMAGGNVVICNGDISLKGGSSAVLPLNQTPLVISKTGNVSISNGSVLSAIVYAPMGSVSLSGSGQVHGSIYGKSITMSDGAQLIYQAGLKGTSGLPVWMPSPGGTVTLVGYDYR